jgi:hypothetical protein
MSKKRLPKKIELIIESNALVREFDTDHAIRILKLQDKIKLGDYKIYNTDLYAYDGTTIVRREQQNPEQEQ